MTSNRIILLLVFQNIATATDYESKSWIPICHDFKNKFHCQPDDLITIKPDEFHRDPLILGTNLGTTGTHSLFYALAVLDESLVLEHFKFLWDTKRSNITLHSGGGPSYKKEDKALQKSIMRAFHTNHLIREWRAKTRPPSFDAIDRYHEFGINGVADTPVAYYWKELMAHYPGSKIIHTYRNESAWAESRIRNHQRVADFTKTVNKDVGLKHFTELAVQHNKAVICGNTCDNMVVADFFNTPSRYLWKMLADFLGYDAPMKCFPGKKSCHCEGKTCEETYSWS